MKNFRTLVGALMAGCIVTPAMAVDPVTQATIDVNAEIVAGCLVRNSIGLESDLNGQRSLFWGNLDFGSVPATGNGGYADASLAWNTSIRVVCTPGIDLAMSIDDGINGERLLKNQETGSTLQYFLFTDATMSAASAIPVDTPVDLAPFGIDYSDVRYPIFARVMLPEVSPSGQYTDTVRVTLEW